MNSIIHRAKNICKKQLLTLLLACAMLISAAPLQAMALDEKQAEQSGELPAAASSANTQAAAGNWGFESGDLSGWTVLTPGWGADGQGKLAGVVSAVSEGECETPTNQSGSYHLSGLHNGIPGVEGWAVRSPGFLLSGSGWISVKMGGEAAAVKVFLSDGTQVGYYRQNRYKDVNYPYLSQGGAWNEMATYAMDLSEYLGKEMYLVLCDEVVGSSAYAVFDDVVTGYDAAPEPASRFDTVTDGHKKGDPASEVRIPWVKASNSYKPCTENNVQNGGFESGDLTGWTVLTKGFNASTAVVSERTYWAQELPYNQSGDYHLNGWNTGIPEAEGWAVRSSTFVLGGSGYISVKMGGNAAVAKVFLTDGTQVGYYRNFRFHDTNFPYISKGGAWCDMATYVIDLSDYLGKEMYIELHDEVITDGWANAFFDDVVTFYETAPDASRLSDKAPDGHNSGESPKLVYIPWVSVPKTSAEYANQIPNGGFETGDLSGWTIYGSGFPIKNGLPAADSASTYWDQELPFNKSGSYFLNGWALSNNEASTWRVRSTPFTLSGSGWISVKMGGHAAAVRVYRLDGTMVGEFDQSRFCDKEFPYISKGGSWCEMATYLLDLTQNIGEVLYIELCDDSISGGWANAFFDDVVTYYETVPTGKTETVNDGHQPGEKPKTVKIEPVVPLNNLYSPRNGGFEMGNLTGWTLVDGAMKLDIAVLAVGKSYDLDADTDKDGIIDEWRTLPYNISGNFIITGHDATWEESDTWTLRSTPFTLAGSGYISVKMGGATAAFQVRTVKDNKIVAYCEQRRFNDVNFPHISEGGSWRDMAVYVMDLSQFLGEKLVIELMDEDRETGWANAYFDDVIAYYPQKPTTKYDTVIDGYKIGYDEPKEIEIPWIYLDGHENDTLNAFPIVPNLKDVSGGVTASGSTTVTKPDGTTEEIKTTTVNLYDHFKAIQGLPDYQLDGSKLTITKVMCYKTDGTSSSIIADYSNLTVKEGYYVVEYKFEQGGVTQTGRFDISVSESGSTSSSTPAPADAQIVNGGFETGNLTGWTVVSGEGFNSSGAVISALTYWNEKLPYNQAGNYHLNGESACGGGSDNEAKIWTVRSSTFKLQGSGYISWRMGGAQAELIVHDADTDEEIVRVHQSRFADKNFPNVDVGKGSWADMGTYALDLSDRIGHNLYVELHDAGGGGWGQAYFDEVVTYYETAPDEDRTDMVMNSNGCSPAMVLIPWTFKDTFQFTNPPGNDAILATSNEAKNVNLTAKVSGTKASYGDAETDDVEITKVKFGGTTSTTGFDSFDMSTPGTYQVFYQATLKGRKSAEKSFTVSVCGESDIINGGFETGDLTGWTVLEGSTINQSGAVISAQTCWAGDYNQAGNWHLDGWGAFVVPDEETETWSIKSSTFTLQGEGYISVRMAGRAAAVKVYKVDDTNDTQVGYYRDTTHDNNHMSTYVMDLRKYLGQKLYIVLCDETIDGGWRVAFFDEVKTYYATAPNWSDGVDWQIAKNELAPSPTTPPTGTQITNGGFETGDLTGWTPIGFEAGDDNKKGILSAQTYWGENLPYNQAGNYHLDGWNTDIDEGGSWAVRSEPFKLDGSGWISVRMGGNAAAVKVYKVVDGEGVLVGYYEQTGPGNVQFPNVSKGSWADMRTYVMNLVAIDGVSTGDSLYIELCDIGSPKSGWNNAYFDEVITYYATAPDYSKMSDLVINGKDQDPAVVTFPWTLAENKVSELATAMVTLMDTEPAAEEVIAPEEPAEPTEPTVTEETGEPEAPAELENPAEPVETDVNADESDGESEEQPEEEPEEPSEPESDSEVEE